MEISNRGNKTFKVLVIDPDRSMKSRFDALLRNYEKKEKLGDYTDYSLSCSYNATTGCRRAKKENPDLVILETSFDGDENTDGIEHVLKPLLALRAKGKFTGKVYCWSYWNHKAVAKESGADVFIKKDKGLTRVRRPIDTFLE